MAGGRPDLSFWTQQIRFQLSNTSYDLLKKGFSILPWMLVLDSELSGECEGSLPQNASRITPSF